MSESKSHVFNAGAPVWSLDWCPIHPDDRQGMSCCSQDNNRSGRLLQNLLTNSILLLDPSQAVPILLKSVRKLPALPMHVFRSGRWAPQGRTHLVTTAELKAKRQMKAPCTVRWFYASKADLRMSLSGVPFPLTIRYVPCCY
jgi:hypothetical protein